MSEASSNVVNVKLFTLRFRALFVAVVMVLSGIGFSAPANAGTVNCTITITNPNATVNGTANGDVICINANDVTVNTLGGNDTIVDNGDNNIISLGDGNDIYDGTLGDGSTIDGGAGIDNITGTPGEDKITGGDGDDTIVGGASDDTISGGGGADNLEGNAGADTLNGEVGDDSINGGDGVDTENGGAGDDTLVGGSSNDVLTGGNGTDILSGNAGDDQLFGESGTDSLSGGDGNDVLAGGEALDTISGGAGLNMCDFTAGEAITATCSYDDQGPSLTYSLTSQTVDVGSSIGTFTVTGQAYDPSGVAAIDVFCGPSFFNWRNPGSSVVDRYDGRDRNWTSTNSSFVTSADGKTVNFTVDVYVAFGLTPSISTCWSQTWDTLQNRNQNWNGPTLTVMRTPAGQPSSPTSLSFTPQNSTSGILSWTAPTFIGEPALYSYVTQYSTDGSTWVDAPNNATTSVSLAFSNLKADADYWFRVRGENGGTVGQDTKFMSLNWAMIKVRTPASVAPDAPTSLLVSDISSTGFILDWTAFAYNGGSPLTNFTVELSRNGGLTWSSARTTNSTSTRTTVTGAAPGTEYLIRVAAVNAVGASSYLAGSTTTAVIAPGAPLSLSSSSVTSTSLRLDWNLPTSNGGAAITDYKVEFSSNGGTTWNTITHDPSAVPSFNVIGLSNSKSYQFRVTAKNSIGFGTTSAVHTVKTLADAPSAPSAMTMTAITASGIKLGWAAPTNTGGAALTDYKVEMSRDNGSTWSLVPRTVSTSPTLTVTGLAPGTSYLVRVSAKNSAGVSIPLTGSFTTLTTVPGIITNLTLSNILGTSLSLTWDLPASSGGSAITNYQIQVSSNGKTFTNITKSVSQSRKFDVTTGLAAGTKYWFRVAAINATGTGSVSTAVNAVTVGNVPEAPTSLAVTPSATSVKLSWAAALVSGGSAVRNYDVQYSTDQGASWKTVTKPVSISRTLTVTGLRSKTAYLFRVIAVNDVGSSPASKNIALTTR